MDFEGALTSVERGPGDQRQQAIVTLTPGAEEGADNIEGGTGNDWLFGQGQADVLRGDGGETEGDAGPGSCDDGIDNVGSSEGADSNDDSECDGGDDDLIGGSHDDDMFGGPGADIMLGDDGFVDHANTAARADDSAVLIGAPDEGADDMNGEAEDDKMYGQGGEDTMNGGGGGDRMNARGGEVLASGVVKALVAGSDVTWGDMRTVELKGLSGEHEIWVLGWQEVIEPSRCSPATSPGRWPPT